MTLQSGTTIQQVHQHKWPLRPGVQVHVNDTNSLTLAASGSVLLSPVDQTQDEAPNSNSKRPRSDSSGSQADQFEADKAVDRQVVESNIPYYETLRDQKPHLGGNRDSVGESQATDSGSESTRSVICIKGPCRPKTLIPVTSHHLSNTEACRENSAGRLPPSLMPTSQLVTSRN